MTKFDSTSHKTAIKKAKQYKINMAHVTLIESWPADRSWNTNGESSQNHVGWKASLQVMWSSALLKAVPATKTDQVAQGLVQLSLGCVHRWRLHNLLFSVKVPFL